jgi:shikimate kinase
MNIILIGPRGVGKSKISRSLSKLIGYPVVSTDSIVVYENGGIPIPSYVEKHGWAKFRDIEYSILQKLVNADGIILDCGGGMIFDLDTDGNEILSERKLTLLRKIGRIILLERDFKELVAKVDGDKTRPDLSQSKMYSEILERRLPHYAEAAHFKINASSLRKEEISEKILNWLGKK